jgi:hypothetical protein
VLTCLLLAQAPVTLQEQLNAQYKPAKIAGGTGNLFFGEN